MTTHIFYVPQILVKVYVYNCMTPLWKRTKVIFLGWYHGRRLGAEFGGQKKISRTKNFRM